MKTLLPLLPQVRKSPLPSHSLRLVVNVTSRDIAAMDDALESGMFDLETSTAISLALQRHLPCGPWRIRRVEGHCCALCGDRSLALPQSVGDWLEQCLRGLLHRPLQFHLEIPRSWVTDNVLPALSPARETRSLPSPPRHRPGKAA